MHKGNKKLISKILNPAFSSDSGSLQNFLIMLRIVLSGSRYLLQHSENGFKTMKTLNFNIHTHSKCVCVCVCVRACACVCVFSNKHRKN